MIVTSASNPHVRAIRALRNRKERERTGQTYAEGIRAVGAAVESGAVVESLVVAPELLTSEYGRGLVRGGQRAGVRVLAVTPEIFKAISTKENPQGLGAVVRQRWEPLDGVRLGDDLCWVALEGVQDPGNLGTILRTSDAVGGAGVILLGATTDPYDPGAIRASTGAVFSQRLVRASFEELGAWKQLYGYTLVGSSGGAARAYTEVAYLPPLVLLMGSEREGLSVPQQELCDVVVRIPMVGRTDSLNLAVATGVILYEIFGRDPKAAGS